MASRAAANWARSGFSGRAARAWAHCGRRLFSGGCACNKASQDFRQRDNSTISQPSQAKGSGLLKKRGLFDEPGRRIAQGLRIMMQAQDQLPHRLVPIAALGLDELLDGEGGKAVAGVGLVKNKVQALPLQHPGAFLRQDAGRGSSPNS